MKSPKIFAGLFMVALLGPIGAGCQTHKAVMPLSNGYEEVSHPYHAFLDEPPPARISLQHRNKDGTVTFIWPALYGVPEVLKGDLVVFVAEKAYLDPERVTLPRLFAVRSPDLPLDITDQVLWRWCKATGKNFTVAQKKFSMITPEENNGRLELRLDFSPGDKWVAGRDDWPEQVSLQLDWPHVDEIMRAVKTKGFQENDLRWNTPYIGEKL